MMNNYSLRAADRLTHIRIVVLSLIAAIAVVTVGIAARPTYTDMSAQLEARAPVLKASKPMLATSGQASAVR